MSIVHGQGAHAAHISEGRHKVVFPDDPHSYFVGHVVGDHFHVEDAVHNGISTRKLLGRGPDTHPMAISRLVELGGKFTAIHDDHHVK